MSLCSIDWPTCKKGSDIQIFFSAFNPSTTKLVANIQTNVKIVKLCGFEFPLTINDFEYDNSYVCSPCNALTQYGLEELHKVENPFFRGFIRSMVPMLEYYIKKNYINRIVSVNNWMLSTNLYPQSWLGEGIESLVELLSRTYPEHSIVFRSLNQYTNKPLMDTLVKSGFVLVPSRQLYILDPKTRYDKRHNYKIDLKLLANTPYRYADNLSITSSDIPRITELYNMLYLEKYSWHNPQFTDAFIENALHNPCFFFEGFRNEQGILEAVGGRFTVDNITSLPIVGYNTKKSSKEGLYRLVLISTMKWAFEQGIVFNASSGASHYKMLRGGKPNIEYSAVYTKHLPKPVQEMWNRLAYILNKLVIPMMKKYQL